MAKQRKISHAHWRIAETAQAMAHEVYDELMKRNDWYDLWKSQHPGLSGKGLENAWVKDHWADFIPGARATLGAMLAQPLDPDLKESIYEALVDDNTLVRGRLDPKVVLN